MGAVEKQRSGLPSAARVGLRARRSRAARSSRSQERYGLFIGGEQVAPRSR